MKNLILVIFALVSLSASSQIRIDSAITISAFGSLSVPTEKNQKFALEGLWFKVDATPKYLHGAKVNFNYNLLTNYVLAGNISYGINFSELNTKVTAGRIFSHSWGDNMVSSPKTNILTRWPLMFNGFPVNYDGVEVELFYSQYGIKIAGYSMSTDEKKRVSLSLQLPYTMFFYTQDDGFGMMSQAGFFKERITVWGGVAKSEKLDRLAGFIQTKISLTNWFTVGTQLDAEKNMKPAILAGLTIMYNPNCFLKLYWDTKDNSAQSRITFAF